MRDENDYACSQDAPVFRAMPLGLRTQISVVGSPQVTRERHDARNEDRNEDNQPSENSDFPASSSLMADAGGERLHPFPGCAGIRVVIHRLRTQISVVRLPQVIRERQIEKAALYCAWSSRLPLTATVLASRRAPLRHLPALHVSLIRSAW